MWLVLLGLLLTGLKLAGLTGVAAWSWWIVLAPYALAAAWWKFADSSGITQRNAMRRADELAAQRRDSQFEALGLRVPKASYCESRRCAANSSARIAV